MADRLSSLDASFLYREETTTPLHVGSVMIFTPGPQGFTYELLLDLVGNRIGSVPRYRQRVREVPGRMGSPVWVDDDQFDITYHVRRSALPRPGSAAQLEEFVARVQSRALDRHRPLWEIYLVEGLERGRFALVTKTHEALVDGHHAVDLAQVIVDPDPGRQIGPPQRWHPAKTPSDLELLAGAAVAIALSPRELVHGVRDAVTGMTSVAGRVLGVAGGAAGILARSVARPAPDSLLNRPIGAHRRYVMVQSELATYQLVRARLVAAEDFRDPAARSFTVHAVVLATITGALRSWLMTRGEGIGPAGKIRAMVPLSVPVRDGVGEAVVPCFIDLPVGEPRPMMRLRQIAYDMQQQVEGGASAASMVSLGGYGPPTLHSLGARLGSAITRRMFNLVITNVPGPQQPLFAADAQLDSTFPVIPLARAQALTIGITSYHGKVCFGLNADRDAMPDLDVLGQCIEDSLSELAQEGAA
ncbi:wax ester/triacylglycerol synthase family O-acyltransferase [Dermatophilaceae bacterium Sec6.4]